VKTCLIVDDSGPIRAVLAKMLHRLGLEPSEAGNGLEALAICEDKVPDSILLDWYMPGMDGIDFLKTLSAVLPKSRMPVVIFCTAEAGTRQISEALAAGARGYIMKPFDRKMLESTFRNLAILS